MTERKGAARPPRRASSGKEQVEAGGARRRLLVKEPALGGSGAPGRLRRRFARAGTFVLNLISAPGSGKTELLTETARRLRDVLRIAVIAGDVQTDADASRIRSAGVPAAAIETHGACHLKAEMIEKALEELPGNAPELLFIENVGNLVCPSAFDLGEDGKVALVSLPEGDDKPAKYPAVFSKAVAFVVTKMDLKDVLRAAPEKLVEYARAIRPGLSVFLVSARTGEGLDEWCRWLVSCAREKRARRGSASAST